MYHHSVYRFTPIYHPLQYMFVNQWILAEYEIKFVRDYHHISGVFWVLGFLLPIQFKNLIQTTGPVISNFHFEDCKSGIIYPRPKLLSLVCIYSLFHVLFSLFGRLFKKKIDFTVCNSKIEKNKINVQIKKIEHGIIYAHKRQKFRCNILVAPLLLLLL